MKIAWVSTFDERDGIGLYSRRYVDALRALAAIDAIDTQDLLKSPRNASRRARACDVVHVQYEPSFFVRGLTDSYSATFPRLNKPLVVSLHEVYEDFPGVFPRRRIQGRGVVRWIKEFVYDIRHQVHARYRVHLRHGFWARRLLVHYDFQKGIIERCGISGKSVRIVPHPVLPAPGGFITQPPELQANPVRLGSTGFINPNYDYDLLFDALGRCTFDWQFTWVGGIRREEHAALLSSLRQHIGHLGWEDRFRITGWVSDEEQARLLGTIDIYLALFKHRSSSGSITTALGARRLIVANRLALTEALNGGGKLMLLCAAKPDEIVSCIRHLLEDPALRSDLWERSGTYVNECTYTALAPRLLRVYKGLI